MEIVKVYRVFWQPPKANGDIHFQQLVFFAQINGHNTNKNKVGNIETPSKMLDLTKFLDQRYFDTMRFEQRVPDYVVFIGLLLVLSVRYEYLKQHFEYSINS